MAGKKSEQLTSEKFAELVRKTPDSHLERELAITTSNMEILLGAGNPEENEQKVLDFFRSSQKWQDNKQYWIEQSKNALYPEDRTIASIRAQQEHFRHLKSCIGVSIYRNQNKFGLEGDYTTDISFYDLENAPIKDSEVKKRIIADTFCELMAFSEKNNMHYVVKHSNVVYTGDRGFLVAWKPD